MSSPSSVVKSVSPARQNFARCTRLEKRYVLRSLRVSYVYGTWEMYPIASSVTCFPDKTYAHMVSFEFCLYRLIPD